MRVRLVIADDDPMARELMGLILERDARFVLAGTASDGTEAITVAQEHQPDALLLDVHMPGAPTADVVRSLRMSSPQTRVLLLSAVHADQAKDLCEQVGADGFVPKGLTSGVLLERLAEAFGAAAGDL